MKRIVNDASMKSIRRALRSEGTECERRLWIHLRNRQLHGLRFLRQYSIGQYVVDFYCPRLRLVIELDGGQHMEDEAIHYDGNRTSFMETQGISVLRYGNNEIMQNIDGVIEDISSHLTPPSLPLRQGEGYERIYRHVHLVGIGGINMSAVAKLLLASGVRVSGSDRVENEQTRLLKDRGVEIFIGHAATNLSPDIDLVIYTSAVPADNSERVEARRRGVRELTNFEFLGEWTKDKRTILVTGTHGKSTTTAMLGSILMEAKLNPTILVGSVVPGFSDGNVQRGSADLWVIEGDEYARHFLAFHPFGVIVNNLELDHTDIFSSLEDMIAAFRELLHQVQDDGMIVWNESDEQVKRLVHAETEQLEARGIHLVSFDTTTSIPSLHVPGEMNAMNARAAVSTARVLGVSEDSIAIALSSFRGIWRRFELLSDSDDVLVYSDYGHHPTAVAATLRAAHELYPERRVLLCFQPHQHNRTRHLFLDFVTSFDEADELVVCEIYDVAGREEAEDQKVSSRDLVDAIIRHDADRGVTRRVEYAENPETAIRRIKELAKPGDCVIVMGAGDIDAAARNIFCHSDRGGSATSGGISSKGSLGSVGLHSGRQI